jgi:Zn-dependent protease
MWEAWPVPYIINPQNLAVDAVVAFCVSVLLTIMINAEAQAFAATFLGDARKDAKDRFNFNAFLHLDILGTICYLVGGFGWPRTMSIDPGKFKHPRLFTVLVRAAGPMANLLLACIGGSVVMFMNIFKWNPRVFLMVIGVNITTAVYNLIFLPPMAAGTLIYSLIPERYGKVKGLFWQIGPFAILALALLERITGKGIFSPYLNPMVSAIYNYIQM